MKGEKTLFSKGNDDWETPNSIFEQLDAEFHFNLDPCATKQNKKCEKYISIDENGLVSDWGGCRVFCNPPYSAISDWVRKAYYEAQKPGTVVVLLIPARTDTRYFHDYIMHRSEIRFIRGRIKFGGSENNAPFPSMVVIFRAPEWSDS